MALLKVSPSHIVVAVENVIYVFGKDKENNFSFKHDFAKDNNNISEEMVDCISFSPNFKYFAALFSDKKLVIWSVNLSDAKNWEKFGEKTVNRRSTSVAFSLDESTVYVADKSGDLYSFSLKGDDFSTTADTEPVLGHVSILMDVAVTEKFIITADRDEKIRISDRERPYIIHNFCLGHTELVCKILPFCQQNMLLSTSGDGTLCVWKLESGNLIQQCDINTSKGDLQSANGDRKAEKMERAVPSLVTLSADEKLLAVSCTGKDGREIKVLQLDGETENPVKLSYEITCNEVDCVLDIAFANRDDRTLLYAMVKRNETAQLICFNCSNTSYSDAGHCTWVDSVNSVLKGIPIQAASGRSYSHLFKTSVPGNVYEVFYKKKENQFKKQKNSAKKPKLEE